MSKKLLLSLLIVLGLLCYREACAQLATGDVLGSVTDSTGASIPGADVQIENLGTHEIRKAKSASDGAFGFTLLQPGTYKMTVQSSGFKTFVNPKFVLVAGDRARLDSALQIGGQTETVEVDTQPTALQTDSTTVGASIDAKAISDLPLNGRNVYVIAQVSPGVNAGSANSLSSGNRPDDRRSSSSVSANGQYELNNNNLLDGMDNNERYKGLILTRPSVEAIQSVRVDTNLFTAEVSRTAGAAINILTKSGTNAFHGSVYEFFRNDVTDARNYFARTSILARKPELRQNQFGASLGGRIIKDKTFFFADFEELRQVDATGTVYTSTVPTLFEEQNPGNISDICAPVTSVACMTPITTTIDPTALGYFKLFPAPNQPGTRNPTTGLTTNNFLYNPPRVQNLKLGDLRVDEHFTDKDLFFVRYSYNKTSTFTPGPLPAVNGVYAGGTTAGNFPGESDITTNNGLLSYTHIFSPHLAMNLRGAYTLLQDYVTSLNFGRNLNNSAPYSIPNANNCFMCSGMAVITPANGYAAIGDATFLPILLTENTYQYNGDLTYTRGPHTFKTGANLTRRIVSNIQHPAGEGSLTFLGTPQVAFQAFFKGSPFNYQRQSILVKPYFRVWEPSVFVQDDWRVNRILTLNLGVRYDVFTAPSEKNGNNALINLTTGVLNVSQQAGVQTRYSNVAPRFGFVATVAPNTVLRGGYGITFFASDIQNAFQPLNPPYSFSSGTVTSNTALSAGILSPASPSTTNLSGLVTGKPFNFHDAYVEQFNLLMQRDFAGNVFTIGYVGSVSRHQLNQIPNLDVGLPTGTSTVAALPYAAILPNVNTIQYYGDFGAASYHSLQTSFERRLQHGLTVNANYTWAHEVDDVILQANGETAFGLIPTQSSTYDYGNGNLDLRHRIAATANYAIPYASTGSTLKKTLFGGWQVNALSFWQTGFPFAISSAVTQTTNSLGKALAYTNLNFITVDRPNVVANPMVNTPASSSVYNFFNPAAFARQPIGTPGNAGRNQLHGPHQRRTDLSLFKTFPVTERVKAEFRVECFNISNTANFSAPGGQITGYAANSSGQFVATNAGNFGVITATSPGSAARQFQFALKATF